MDYLENGNLPKDERKVRVGIGKIIVSSCEEDFIPHGIRYIIAGYSTR